MNYLWSRKSLSDVDFEVSHDLAQSSVGQILYLLMFANTCVQKSAPCISKWNIEYYRMQGPSCSKLG